MSAMPDTGLQTDDAPPLREVTVHRQRRAGDVVTSTNAVDRVATEVPVALVFNGISHAVMMATPADLEEFAIGFALSEGLIDSTADCRGVDVVASPLGCEVQLDVASRVEMRLKEQRRSLAGRTGCGLCGIDSLERLDLHPTPLAGAGWVQQLDAATVLRAFEQLPAKQPMNRASGAHHAAGWVDASGTLHTVMEDVGRHNALDKLLGSRARTGQRLEDGFVVMSSRASYELVRKCARLGVPALAVISAPTSLAIDIAVEAKLQLYGFCRGDGAVRYA